MTIPLRQNSSRFVAYCCHFICLIFSAIYFVVPQTVLLHLNSFNVHVYRVGIVGRH